MDNCCLDCENLDREIGDNDKLAENRNQSKDDYINRCSYSTVWLGFGPFLTTSAINHLGFCQSFERDNVKIMAIYNILKLYFNILLLLNILL